MRKNKLELVPEQLRRACDPDQFDFETTETLTPTDGTVGQTRAMAALAFGMEIGSDGYNVYVAGDSGTSRSHTTETFLEQVAKTKPVPGDWVYVYNFADPYEPVAISLPAGMGDQLASDMDRFVEACKQELPRAFESEHYEQRKTEIMRDVENRREQLSSAIQEEAKSQGFAIQTTPLGIVTVPLQEGQPMSREAYEELDEEKKREIQEKSQHLQSEMAQVMGKARKLEKEAAERIRELDREVALFAVGHLLSELREQYARIAPVMTHLDKIQEDIVDRLDELRSPEKEAAAIPMFGKMMREESYDRYKVNLLVSNRHREGAPVVVENNPTYYNLIGRIDYRARLGGMTTDFTMIKSGAFHRANGGYLLIQAIDLLTSPQSWDALKKTIRARQVRIENLGEQFSAIPTATLKPEPIPVNVKVVMVGPPFVYHLLFSLDEDFRSLFKVRADFGVDMARSEEHQLQYARFIAAQVAEQGLKHFDRGGVARVVEHGSRMQAHQGRLSTKLQDVGNLLAEASYWAQKDEAAYVQSHHVQRAIEEKIYRSNLVEEKLTELVMDGTLIISTEGAVPGQVNGLSVLTVGDYSFGRPSRITARTSFGQSGVVNIEREIKMSGRIHSKGVLILAGYLAGKYAQDKPLALSASLTFEQLYDEIEGDSASTAELYALLSSLSGLPLRQDIAVTGSVNQRGEIQPIGGVNEKVEGYFEICKRKGLTNGQGVLIPSTNVQHLMLKDEVVDAVREGRFHIFAARTVDEGIALLTGRRAGQPLPDGTYPPNTVNNLVDQRLREFATRFKEFAGPRLQPAASEEEREAA